MPRWKSRPWRRDPNEIASGKPGAVQYTSVCVAYRVWPGAGAAGAGAAGAGAAGEGVAGVGAAGAGVAGAGAAGAGVAGVVAPASMRIQLHRVL